MQATRLLAPEAETVRFGARAGRAMRVTPDELAAFAAVITIGKTVQFGLAMRMPGYIYDRHGGPGWLSAASFAQAAAFNFAGLCCGRRLGVRELTNDILAGCDAARAYAGTARDGLEARYHLPRVIAVLTWVIAVLTWLRSERSLAELATDRLRMMLEAARRS